MKKLLLISAVTASLLLVGCGEKPKEEAKKEAVQEIPAKEVAKIKKEAPKAEAKEEVKKEAVKEEAPAVKEEQKKVAQEAKPTVNAASLYAKCAGCHGSKGEKKALGKSTPIGGWDKAKLVRALKGYKAGTVNSYGMGPLMKGQVGSLSDEEIEALANYISKLK